MIYREMHVSMYTLSFRIFLFHELRAWCGRYSLIWGFFWLNSYDYSCDESPRSSAFCRMDHFWIYQDTAFVSGTHIYGRSRCDDHRELGESLWSEKAVSADPLHGNRIYLPECSMNPLSGDRMRRKSRYNRVIMARCRTMKLHLL